MKKNRKIWISLAAFAAPIVLPLVAASCNNGEKSKDPNPKNPNPKDPIVEDPGKGERNEYANVPKSLLESVKNNFGILYSEKLINEKANVTSKSVLDKLLQKPTDLVEISKILAPYAYVNFDNINTSKFKYELNTKKSKATSGVLHLIFKVTPLSGDTSISFDREFDLINFQKDLTNTNTHEIAGMVFSETVTTSGEEITGPMLVHGLKALTSKSPSEQLAYLRKYITISGNWDESTYDLNLHPEYIHDHGLTNVHMKVSFKAKNESKWKESIFFVYGFDAKNKSDVFGLKTNEKSKRITSTDLLVKIKNANTWDEQFAILREYFTVNESDSFKYYDYEINKEKSIIPNEESADKKNQTMEPDNKSLNLIVNKIDKFDKSKKTEINFEIRGLGVIKSIGYLEFEDIGYGNEEFAGYIYNVKYSDLKKFLDSEGFKKLNSKKQITEFLTKVNEGIDSEESKLPARIAEDLVSKYDMKLHPEFTVKAGLLYGYPIHIATFTFEITDKTTNKTSIEKIEVSGFDFTKEKDKLKLS
ncbi:variable surface lipoprotein [Mycoplasma phocoeninasale]|uniref:Variable surface lipoprotein n=1 Tax=Mycoplasma phocoeninasale TaxID=2726117 RepID=A0A858U1R5_9MOLU|nr:variable surface lipoprotein [Mycoplasma phocoeninasale]QJG66342.1 variable surface lipoprotein [Mycoplasma phocoeninasale]